MGRLIRWVVVWGALAFVVGGCVDKAKTPKEAIANVTRAILENNKAQFLASAYAGEDGKEYVEALFEFGAAVVHFNQEMEKAYGKDPRWDMEKDSPLLLEKRLAKVEVWQEETKATATFPDNPGHPMSLIRIDGVWMVDMTKDLPSSAGREQMVRQSKAFAQAVERALPKIGKEGTTKESILSEVAANTIGLMLTSR